MAVVVRGRVPADAFALRHVLEAVPDTRFEVERVVESGEETVMPLVWVRGADRERLEAALQEDPSVESFQVLAAFDGEFLLGMEWVDRVGLLVDMLTTPGSTVLEAVGHEGEWHLRVLFPQREAFSQTHEFCREHGLELEIESIRELDAEPAGRFGLTIEQYRTLVYAARRGYFSVPREITLEELADEVGVSHQALSERLRRGTEALVEDTLMVGSYAEPD